MKRFLLLFLTFTASISIGMEQAQPAKKSNKNPVNLSLISTDQQRFWVAANRVAHFNTLRDTYQKLDENKLLKTDLDAAAVRLLKDLIDTHYEEQELKRQLQSIGKPYAEQDLKTTIERHAHTFTLTQYGSLFRETQKLGLAPIAQAIGNYLYQKQSDFSLDEFKQIGQIGLAHAKLIALKTHDRVFILPESMAIVCPYLNAMANSQFHESTSRTLNVPVEYSSPAVGAVKKFIEYIHQETVLHKKKFEALKPALKQMAQQMESLSIDAIKIADQWLMPEIAHIIAQALLQKKPETIAEVPEPLHKYIPPFKAEDALRFKESALLYLEWIADSHENRFFEKSQEALAMKLIEHIAEHIDNYIDTSHALTPFQKPKMRAMTVLLNAQLVQKKKIIEEPSIAIQPYLAVTSMSVHTLPNHKFVVGAMHENPKIYSNTGKHLATLRGDLFEHVKSVSTSDKDSSIVTASYYRPMMGYDSNLYLKVWKDDGTLVKTKTIDAPGKPEVRLQVLDGNTTLVTLGNERMLWDGYRNTLRKADIALSTHVAPLERNNAVVCVQDDPNTYSLGILNFIDNTKTVWKRAAGKCQGLLKLDDNHILLNIAQEPLQIWNTNTRTCQNTIDRNALPHNAILSNTLDEDHILLVSDECALIYNYKKNLIVKNLTDSSPQWHNQHHATVKEKTTFALPLDATHVATVAQTPGANKVVIKHYNELLPIEEIVRKRNEQAQREQSYCTMM